MVLFEFQTLGNQLLRINKNQAETANRPGVTKGQRWLKIGNDFELLDTPGIYGRSLKVKKLEISFSALIVIKDALLFIWMILHYLSS